MLQIATALQNLSNMDPINLQSGDGNLPMSLSQVGLDYA